MSRTRIITLMLVAMVLSVSLSSFAATIHEVVKMGDVQKTNKLIAANRGVVNARNELGSTPLHVAAGSSAPEIVRLLLDKGAALNSRDNRGVTPLHVAAFSGHKANVEQLLARGADVHARDNQGKTARDYAEISMSREISAILLIKMLAVPTPAARK